MHKIFSPWEKTGSRIRAPERYTVKKSLVRKMKALVGSQISQPDLVSVSKVYFYFYSISIFIYYQ